MNFIMPRTQKSIHITKKISEIIKKYFKDQTIKTVTDYKEKNMFVIYAVPNGQEGIITDAMYAVDKKTYKVTGFNPLENNPNLFFNLSNDRVIYEQ